MRNSNTLPSFGSLFSTTTAFLSPAHEAIVRKPLYDAVPPLRIRPSVLSLLRRLASQVGVWRQQALQRKQLAALDDHLLQDIGLDRHQVAEEWEKPFWKA